MLINSVVLKEQKRNTEMIINYKRELEVLPKGNLTIKKVGNHKYYYLKYRNDKKIVTDYIGKDNDKIETIKKQIKKRKHCENMLNVLQNEQRIISKILEGLD